MIKQAAGFALPKKPPTPAPLTKAHFAISGGEKPLTLKAIRNIKNVNRLSKQANLEFAPIGLTLIYGRNGSGKSGFVRIFRTACRTRIENAATLKVLADVYGPAAIGPQEAEIVIDNGSGETPVPWKAGAPAREELLQIAVFDSAAAQLYVDHGNQIRFFPSGLALPYRLNELCSTLKVRLEAERTSITAQLLLAKVTFESVRLTAAQLFFDTLNGDITDAQIDAASSFTDENAQRLITLTKLLIADPSSAADFLSLATWLDALEHLCAQVCSVLSDEKLTQYKMLRQEASEARKAASLGAKEFFANEPLEGVGGETWRRLWAAAKEYSLSEAYPDEDFPVLVAAGDAAKCVFC